MDQTYLNILAGHIEFTNAGGVDLALARPNYLKQRLPTPFIPHAEDPRTPDRGGADSA